MLSSIPNYSDEEISDLLNKSGVANDVGHYKEGVLHTAITSRDELIRLINLVVDEAYNWGYEDGSRTNYN